VTPEITPKRIIGGSETLLLPVTLGSGSWMQLLKMIQYARLLNLGWLATYMNADSCCRIQIGRDHTSAIGVHH
jgi:hypothetical protein